nr:immunoglobulin light chain junction region [Macaca mulatta]MOW15019.1 immunoglobulin light chain junction region [Macaca mulatta]MOW15443.1 immunoglobulin light chain junction region [Macaca mulatta]MOW15530.1 immunoglobulin light chain junction region [Macaca mulatta]MOW15602.1 immunoglobulin light chain junction region [Macaca mulatta]
DYYCQVWDISSDRGFF